MARPTGGAFVGVDIGSQTIKVVEVRGAGSSLQVTALGQEITPPGLIEAGVIMDPKALGTTIKALLSRSGVSGKRCVSSVAGTASVVVRVIEVPRMNAADLAETMKWEVERHIPFAANDVEMSYQAIEDPEANPDNPNMEVLLAVAQRDTVGFHLETLQAAGLSPVAIDVEPLAAGRALIDVGTGDLREKNVVVVNIGASNTDVGIFRKSILSFPRTVPLAGNNFTQAIADHFGLSMDAAEEEKRANAVVFLDVVGAIGTSEIGADSGSDSTMGTTPFDSPFVTPSADNPFAAPPAPAADNPFATPAAPATDNPFATPAAPGALPWEAPAPPAAETPAAPAAAPGALPWETPGPDAAPDSDNPFAAPPVAGEPPAGPASAELYTEENPFALPTPAAPAVDDPAVRRRREIFDAIAPILGEFASELRRSIEYFQSRYPTETIDMILLCGGSALIQNLDQYLQADLGITTMVANPFTGVRVGGKHVSEEMIRDYAPAFAVAMGLASRDAVLGPDRK